MEKTETKEITMMMLMTVDVDHGLECSRAARSLAEIFARIRSARGLRKVRGFVLPYSA